MNHVKIKDIENELKDLNLTYGGKNSPILKSDSKETIQKVAIIVPYRNREKNLNIFLLYMHQFLSRQNIYYSIFIVEPAEYLKFNRALLINVGFIESLKDDDYNCFIFHDVDLLPENKNNIYNCDLERPKQMAISVNINGYP